MHGTAKLPPSTHPRSAAQPVYIEGMFAWLHRPQPDWGGETAVLICSALNRDALDSHRHLRVLADEFAACGFPALRFDYPGTGDSCDLADTKDSDNCWLAWQHGVQTAADYLQAATGATRLILCGLRAGATLAALAAEQRSDVSGLILLAPVIRGHSYIRQLWVEFRLQQSEASQFESGFTFQELSLSEQAVKSIGDADLRAVKMPAGRHIAICAQSSSGPLAACELAWKQQNAVLWSSNFNGLESLLLHDPERDVPPADFSEILRWAKLNFPPRPLFQPSATRPGTRATLRLRREGVVETPTSFGPNGGLFGMLCQPEAEESDIAMIFCGAGYNPHYGVGRSTVNVARHLAKAGIASLRIDFAGQGDSMGPPGRETKVTSPFEPRLEDIQAAIDRMEMLGYRRFAVQGICSGAFHAFHAALAEPRIGMLVLVNMPIFQEADASDSKIVMRSGLPWFYYLDRLLHRNSWMRLFSGQTNYAAILLAQVSRLRAKAGQLRQITKREPPTASFARAAVAQLSQRGVETVFLFGPDEVGLYAVEDIFGPKGVGLTRLDHVSLKVIDTFDHVIGLPLAQKDAATAMLGDLLSWHSAA